ncbi:hypothetical protein [Burkholderia sp. WSM2232]|uniref:hypothetical protein n=1 Tax=Burkholderia sp. WSM2232 TaxID=944436 RepID=UPI001E416F85|nr:hypothetical protein [Burkholderia sp. WSM2232]
MTRTANVMLLWTEIDGIPIPTLRATEGELIEPVSTYLDRFAQTCSIVRDVKRRQRKIRAVTYAALELTEFLLLKGKRLNQLDDDLLREFRSVAFEATKNAAASRGHDYQAETTTNTKLRYIYECIDECQYSRLLPPNTIGWENCRIKSSLPDVRTRQSRLDLRSMRKYPLLFDRTGGKTDVDLGQYWMTDEDVRLVEEHFRTAQNKHAQERNVLLLRTGELQGWRAASINSLTVEQFSPNAFHAQANNDRFLIRPGTQKGRKRFAFEMRWELANEIARYVREDRQALLQALNKDESTAQSKVFLNVVEGTPLEDKTIYQLFSTALRSLGRPKGAASHSMRRRKGQSLTEEEIDFRKREHLSLAREDIQDAVAAELGHASRESQRAYVMTHKIRRLQTVEEKQHALIEQLRSENGALKSENRDLKSRIVTLLENQLTSNSQEEGRVISCPAGGRAPKHKNGKRRARLSAPTA